jgi:hypothetical protein
MQQAVAHTQYLFQTMNLLHQSSTTCLHIFNDLSTFSTTYSCSRTHNGTAAIMKGYCKKDYMKRPSGWQNKHMLWHSSNASFNYG